MRGYSFRSSVVFTAVLAFSTFAVAQHGRPAGAGPGMAGGGGTVGGAGIAHGGSNRPADTGSMGTDHSSMGSGMSNMGSQSPSSVLSNTHMNTALASALEKSGISVPGSNLQAACGGFKNLGQCVAAMHVAKNLNLPFSDLQNLMTGSNPESLGKALKGLGGPDVNAKSESKKASKEAKQDIQAAASAAAQPAS